MKLSRIKDLILDIFFPVNCLGCGEEGIWLCKACSEKINKPRSFFTGLKNQFIDRIVIARDYQDSVLQKAIHCFKYKFVVSLSADLAGLVTAENLMGLEDFTFIPIPLHRRRYKWREFNQAEEIVKSLNQRFNLKTNFNLLIRKKYTVPQMSLRREERLQNIEEAFAVDQSKLPGIKKVVLVDDVLTTGATLNEVAKVLKEAGVKEVVGLVLAHG